VDPQPDQEHFCRKAAAAAHQAVVGSIIQSTRACRGARRHLHMPPIHPAS
jgi:hypothetical protein